MPNDARLGLVVGVTMVILVAVLFARKDGRPVAAASTAAVMSKAGLSAPVPGVPGVPLRVGVAGAPAKPRSHTVGEGDTLMNLSKRYYGDTGHVSYLFRANQDRILAPDKVPLGTVLRIPDAPREPAPKLDR